MDKYQELNIPFNRGRRSPGEGEILWLRKWLLTNCEKDTYKTLEFGAGITSWILYDALRPKLQLSVEMHKRCIEMVKGNIPDLVIVSNWDDIPQIPYDVVLIDGSPACPERLRKSQNHVYRLQAIQYIEQFISPETLIIIHDWNGKRVWRLPREYMETKNYDLVASLPSRKRGWGIYRRGQK